MIYPKSFPSSSNASYSEEYVYNMFQELLQEQAFLVSYEHKITVSKKKNKIRIVDFLLFDHQRGILIVEVVSRSTDPSTIEPKLVKLKEDLALSLKKDCGIKNIPIFTTIWGLNEHEKQNSKDFGDWLSNKFNNSQIKLSKLEIDNIKEYLQINNRYYTPTGYLSSFLFKNFLGIKSTSIKNLPTDAPWIFITGENGFGKTSILRAIASGLFGEVFLSDKNTFEGLSITGSTMVSSEEYENTKISLKVTTRYSLSDKNVKTYNYPKKSKASFYRNICAYGASRLDTYENDDSHKSEIKNPILSLYKTSVSLRNIEHYLKLWAHNKDKVISQKFDHTKSILEELLDGITIEVTPSSRVWYKEKDFGRIQFHQLASGYRSLIAMVGDIIIRMFEAQPDVINPAEFEGVVIIDEVDLHWHPKWQRKLPGLLSNLFPKIQFIASTHSPIPLLGAPEKSVFLKVNRTEEEGITVQRLTKMEKEMKNLLPNIVLTSSVFDMDEIKAITNKDITRVRVSDSLEEEEFYNLVDQKLEELLAKDKNFPYDTGSKK